MQHNTQNNNFRPSSQYQTNMSRQFGNLQQAFSNNQQIIERPDFANKGNVIHNNMADLLKDQKVVEYKIHIDSKDRDTSVNKSPFNFKVTFGENKSFKINRKFFNVKYVNVDCIILPKHVSIDVSRITSDLIYPTSSNIAADIVDSSNPLTKLTANKYIILKIEELGSQRIMGTSTLLDNNTFILCHERCMGLDCDVWRPIHGTIVFPSTQPLTISQLTIKLYDFMGNEIKLVDQNGNDIIKNNITGAGKNYINYVKDNYLNDSVVYTDNIEQMTVMMTFGVVENEMAINNC
jgi:hypothetical protein